MIQKIAIVGAGLGPMLKANYWEAIAVPELRLHSAKLAQTLIENSQ